MYNSWRYRKTTLAATPLIERVQSDEEYVWARGPNNAGAIENHMTVLEGPSMITASSCTSWCRTSMTPRSTTATRAAVKVVAAKIGNGVADLEASCARLRNMHRASLAV